MSSPANQAAREIKLKPLEKREFLQKQKEDRRHFRLNKLARETSEQRRPLCAEKLVRTAKLKTKRKRTPKELLESAEYNRNRRKRIAASETPEEKAVRLATRREKARLFREKRKAQETPEQSATRLARHAKERLLQKRKRATMYAQETPEQSAEKLRQKQKRTTMYSQETPEQSATRRALALEKQNLRQQKRRAMMYATETPEQRAARSLILAKNLKPYRNRKKATPAENERRRMERQLRAKAPASEKPKQMVARRMRAADSQNTRDQTSSKLKDAEREAIDGSFHSSCSISFSGLSEGGNSITTTESTISILTTTDEFSLAEQNPEESFVVKNEASLDSWSCVGGSQRSSVAKIPFQDNRDFESSQGSNCKSFARNKNTWKEKTKTAKQKTVLDHNLPFVQTPSADDCLAYGNFIAHRISKSNRNDVEIKYAKALIKDILLNLSTGVYSHLIPDKPIEVVERKMSESLPSFAIIAPIQQDIIVKEEVDL